MAEGVNVVITARGDEALQATAEALRAFNLAAQVLAVAGDITTPEGRAAALAACPQVDILVNNAGGPPPGDFRDWDRADWLRAVEANMLTPIELIKAVVDGMAGRGYGRVINITSASVKAPIDALGLPNGARSGLTGFKAISLIRFGDHRSQRPAGCGHWDSRTRARRVSSATCSARATMHSMLQATHAPRRALERHNPQFGL